MNFFSPHTYVVNEQTGPPPPPHASHASLNQKVSLKGLFAPNTLKTTKDNQILLNYAQKEYKEERK